MSVGSEQTRLIVLRGNSGSGKSTVAKALRDAYGRGMAWVSQDLLRRTILLEKDRPGAANIGLIDQVARYSLDHDFHVILDGIFYAGHYELMLAGLARDHQGLSRFYYLDVSMDETLRRHTTRPEAAEFGADKMRAWYRPRDLLGSICERVVGETSSLHEITTMIANDTELLTIPYGPVRQADGRSSRTGREHRPAADGLLVTGCARAASVPGESRLPGSARAPD
jgi:energy-coupling factor transporter ATP-binding protein EcfA2